MKKIFLYIIATAALLSGCVNDDFLDKKPLDKLSEEDVFSNATLIESYVNSFYAVIPDPLEEGNISSITDESFFRYGGTSTNYIARGLMTPDNVIYMDEGGSAHNSRTTTMNIWNRVYMFVRNMNDFFDKAADNTVLDEATKNRLMGEVYFLRAWGYFNMVQRYGGVPIITKLYSVGDDYSIERNTFDQCIDFILSDLDNAKKLLPDKPSSLGRVGKDACLALESRVTLLSASPLFNDPAFTEDGLNHGAYSQDKWERCKTATKALIDRIDVDHAYSMAPKYEDFWTNVNSTEVIWAKYLNVNSGKKAQFLYSPAYFGGWLCVQPTEALAIDFEMAATGKKIFEEGSGYDPTKPWEGRDPRFYKILCPTMGNYADSVYNNYVYFNKDGNGTNVTVDNYTISVAKDRLGNYMSGETDDTGYGFKKFHINGADVSETLNTSIMYAWMRVPEIYLNYAEACLMTNDEAGCRTYINKVRSRADVMMPPIPDSETGNNLWDRLVQERRIELCFEGGFRYFDLRRWKLAQFYENVPVFGVRSLAFINTSDSGKGVRTTDDYKQTIDVIYRIAEPYDPTKTQPYDFYKSSTPLLMNKDFSFTDDRGRTMKIKAYVVTYSWLGKEYVVDYGNCVNPNMIPEKYFPEDGRQYFMPIPRTDITKSGNTIVQNPGYN